MKALLQRRHARLGDFWWYSLMLFCAIPIAVFASTFRNELTTLAMLRQKPKHDIPVYTWAEIAQQFEDYFLSLLT